VDGVNALIAFAALMGAAEPALPHHAQIADAFALLALLLLLRRPSRPNHWVAFYLGWALVSAYVHQAGGWKVLGMCELACLFVLGGTLDEEERQRVVRAWVMGAAVLAVTAWGVSALAIAGVETPWTAGGGELGWSFRPKGLAASTNLLASLCLLPFLVCVAERRWWLVVLFGAAMLTSRTLLAAGVGLLLLGRLRHGRLLIVALLLAALASIYVDVHGGSGPGIRWRIALSAVRTIAQHPLFGVGPAALPATAGWPGPNDPPLAWAAHCTPLDIAARVGLPALLAFAVLVWQLRGRGVLAAALGAMLFDALTLDVENFRHLWLLMGLVAGARPREERQSWRRPRPPSGTTGGASR
jgi:hypothetical protein